MPPEYYFYPKLNLAVRLIEPLNPSLIKYGTSPRSLVHRLAIAAGYVDRLSDLPYPSAPVFDARTLDPGDLGALLT